MERRFVTRAEVDRLADAGGTVLEIDRRVTVTDLAAERARERGLRLVRTDAPRKAAPDPAATSGRLTERDVGATVRSAVIAALGEVPPGLDEAISRVLRSR